MASTSSKKRREQKRNTPKRWDAYVAEADIPDFVIEVDDDRNNDIHVKCPTGEQIIEAGRVKDQDIEEGLRLMTGDAFPQVRELVAGAPYPAMMALFDDINDHFDFADPTSPS